MRRRRAASIEASPALMRFSRTDARSDWECGFHVEVRRCAMLVRTSESVRWNSARRCVIMEPDIWMSERAAFLGLFQALIEVTAKAEKGQ
jgi:hypothetical protein